MKKAKIVLSVLLTGVMTLSIFSGCGSSSGSGSATGKQPTKDGIKQFSVFYAMTGKVTKPNNRVAKVIAKKVGATVNETYLTGQTDKERVGVMIAGGKYPDMIDGASATQQLIKAKALIPIDKYWDKYPNIKNFYSKADWEKFRQPDGHIYYINEYGGTPAANNPTPSYGGEAFWIQKQVLIEEGYPKITTLDEYFKVIEDYKKKHPTIDGQPTIGFEIKTDGGASCAFQLENPPQFLAGYPNDGKAIIDPKTLTARDYDTIPEAKEYYKKLNEEYNKGIVDTQTFTSSNDQYISKIATGRVLGLIDQHWSFQTAETTLISRGQNDKTYVPFGVTIDANTKPHYNTLNSVNGGAGLGITVSCKDPEGALKFLNDLLSPEIETLRNWGEKGTDYEVDSKGVYYRTQKQRDNVKNVDWSDNNLAPYGNLLGLSGCMQKDGINAMIASDQLGEFQAGLTDVDKKVLDGYGYKKWTDFMNKPEPTNPAWYPIWSYVNSMPPDDPGLIAFNKVDDIKKQTLPKIIMGQKGTFESNWEQYQGQIKGQKDLQTYEDSLTKEVKRRVKLFK